MRPLGILKFGKDAWEFSKVEPHVMIKLKAVFSKIPKGQTCPFLMPHAPETAVDIAWFLERYHMSMSHEDRAFLMKEKEGHLERMASLEFLFKPNYKFKNVPLKKPLRHYQMQAVELYLKVRKLLVGDVVGLGKTVTAIGSFNKETLPVAVVVQSHLPSQWREKVEEFSDFKVHCVGNGLVYQLPTADVYIFKYSQLAKWVDVLTSGFLKSVVFDEVQELRRKESLKYEAARSVTRAIPYVMGLSATPVYNYGDEIFNILDLIKEECLGERSDFMREWSAGYKGRIVNPKALGTYLRENYLFLRRSREEVNQELPPINRIVETVDYDHDAIDKIEEVAKKLAVKVLSGSFVEKGQASRDLDMMVRHATGVSKAKFVAQYVRMLVEAGEPVLLAGWHRDVYEIWDKEFENLNHVMYTGSETPKQKDEAKRKFMSGESDLMIISLRSGIGLDGLQERASIVVIGELDWSPQIHEQIIGRLNRDGQKQQVTVVFLVSDSGSDPGIVEVLGLKSSQAQGIVDPFNDTEITHSDGSRIQALAKRFLDGRKVELPIGISKMEGISPS